MARQIHTRPFWREQWASPLSPVSIWHLFLQKTVQRPSSMRRPGPCFWSRTSRRAHDTIPLCGNSKARAARSSLARRCRFIPLEAEGFACLLTLAAAARLPERCKTGRRESAWFRSEFLYLGRENAPSEQEQFLQYRAAAEQMDGRMVIVRTLDLVRISGGVSEPACWAKPGAWLPCDPHLPCAAGPFSRPTPRNLPRCCVWSDCGHVSHDHICMAGTAE